MGDPLVSVIIPAFNAETTLSQAIQSVLEQEAGPLQVLVIDDGSKDRTPEILDSFPPGKVRVLRHPGNANCGTCASRRLGLATATGEFIAFLDADDFFLPGKLSRHIEILRRSPHVALVHGRIVVPEKPALEPSLFVRHFDLGTESRDYDLSRERDFLVSNRVCNSTIVCRRSAVSPEDFPTEMVFQFEDWVLVTAAAIRGQFHYDPLPLTAYRISADGFTRHNSQRRGAWELAHIEYLLTLLPRLPHGPWRRRAATVLLDELMRVTDYRAPVPPPTVWPGRQLLSAMTKSAFPRYLAYSVRFSKPWRWLSHLKATVGRMLQSRPR